jgi:protein Tex
VLMGKDADPEAAKYRDYFEWTETCKNVPSHRLLAMCRGEKEGYLMMRITVPEDKGFDCVKRLSVTGKGPVAEQIGLAATDSCKRLLFPSMETEFRLGGKKKADMEAIRVFADNFRELLNSAPLGEKRVLAIDPGFRTGCKTVVLSAQGALLHNDVMYATAGSNVQQVEAARLLVGLATSYKIEAIAIGNGTASRETEQFVRKVLNTGELAKIPIIIVNESGASIYSASDVAREEFPDHDVTVRGAVSIGRRLMDPLAELVKIDPKSIGVGQYQHDVDQTQLKNALDDSVISCVNNVGVEVNTASKQLLSYVSGLNKSIAENIVKHRTENGPFKSRAELKKVPRLGDKAFEQAAGFLRIRGGEHPLDSSAVHPERYALVEKMAADLGCSVKDLLTDEKKRTAIQLKNYVSEGVGLPTLQDILNELAKPGRDPRKQFEMFSFAEGIEKPSDLQVGMKLNGIVTNVTAFGAFVDVGVHQDGLVHVSQLADHFIKDPNEVVKVNQKVEVTVTEVDLARNRIALSMRTKPDFEKKGGPSASGGTGGPRPQGGGGNRPPQRQQSQQSGGGGGFGGGWFDQAVSKGGKR